MLSQTWHVSAFSAAPRIPSSARCCPSARRNRGWSSIGIRVTLGTVGLGSPFSRMDVDLIDTGVSPPSGWSDWITPVDNRPDARAHSYLAQIVSRELERIMRYSTGWTTSHRNEPKEEMNHLKESGPLQNLETH